MEYIIKNEFMRISTLNTRQTCKPLIVIKILKQKVQHEISGYAYVISIFPRLYEFEHTYL